MSHATDEEIVIEPHEHCVRTMVGDHGNRSRKGLDSFEYEDLLGFMMDGKSPIDIDQEVACGAEIDHPGGCWTIVGMSHRCLSWAMGMNARPWPHNRRNHSTQGRSGAHGQRGCGVARRKRGGSSIDRAL